ncbi:MAG TPA: DUF1501 domain-containing protein [Acidimicrobiales bacterium]|nr:DUF1501 domain-containing protein [Acidimicrobiales bacterium]
MTDDDGVVWPGPPGPLLSRRRFLAGTGAVALGTHLGHARASFGAAPGDGALVVVFLRGGMDGLSVIVPGDDPDLRAARPKLAVPSSVLLPLDRGFGLHPALAPLHELWKRGQFTAVPAVSTTDVSRSHFQAQDCLERGGSATGTTEGWLDRVLDHLGPGTPFRAVAAASTLPRALAGDQAPVTLRAVDEFSLSVPDDARARHTQALAALYAGVDHPMAVDVSTTLGGLDVATTLAAAGYQPAATYPEGDFATGLAQLAHLIKADVGLRVACIDVGGWDHHANLGTVDGGEMKGSLTALGASLAAFAADLGPTLDQVTMVAMTEFGRRVAENANGGTDHGHGAAVLLLGGGLAGGTIQGQWPGLSPAVLDHGDVPGANDYRDVLGEVVSARLGLGADALSAVFPGHQVQALGVTR